MTDSVAKPCHLKSTAHVCALLLYCLSENLFESTLRAKNTFCREALFERTEFFNRIDRKSPFSVSQYMKYLNCGSRPISVTQGMPKADIEKPPINRT